MRNKQVQEQSRPQDAGPKKCGAVPQPISRRTGLSRNAIAKYLSAGTIEPKFTIPERPSKLDSLADKLAAWLKTEAGKPRSQVSSSLSIVVLRSRSGCSWHVSAKNVNRARCSAG
jgi:hypothetical protein